jgi:hypothetical protein
MGGRPRFLCMTGSGFDIGAFLQATTFSGNPVLQIFRRLALAYYK